MTPEAMRHTVSEATTFLAPRWRERWNTVCAVVVTRAGRQFMALNVASRLPRAGVCAEPIAIGMAVSDETDGEIVFCATVNRQGTIIPPCGVCRELLLDYARDAVIAVPDGQAMRAARLDELIPDAYESGDRKTSRRQERPGP